MSESKRPAARARADGYPVVIVTQNFLTRLHYRLRVRLPIWVVYDQTTREYQGKWVARMYVSLPEPRVTRFVMTHDTLEELRDLLPPGLTCLARHHSDPPEIIETWL